MAAYGWNFWAAGDYDKAIDASLKSLKLYKDLQDYERMTAVYDQLAVYYRDAEDLGQAFRYATLAKNLYDSLIITHKINGYLPFLQYGTVYLFKNQIDSASFYITKAYEIEKASGQESGYLYNSLGYMEASKKHYAQALEYYRAAISTATMQKNIYDIVNSYTFLAILYKES